MKKCCITFLLFVIIILIAFTGTRKTETDYLRIHIQANSNEVVDQTVKYDVRDGIVLYLTPYVKDLESKDEAVKVVLSRLYDLENLTNEILKERGLSYTARVSLKREEFPTRVYDEITLEAGIYDALVIDLGEGKGDNWWCIVYPAFCFQKTPKVYHSIILDIIRRYIGG